MDNSHQCPPLFRLPRELRDEIYELTLHHPDGLVYEVDEGVPHRFYARSGESSHSTDASTRLREALRRVFPWCSVREHNQLRYVCKRLYRETKGITFLQNEILLKQSPVLAIFDQCSILLHQCTKLRTVVLQLPASDFACELGQKRLFNMFNVFSSHSSILFKVKIPQWSLSDFDFLFRGFSYLLFLRADSVYLKRLSGVRTVTFLSDSVSEMLTTDEPIPKNVRFYPREDRFEAHQFQQVRQRRPILQLKSTEAAIGNVQLIAKQWIQNGL